MTFFSSIKEAVKDFSKIKTPVKVVSHYDADGLTSAAIISRALNRQEKTFSLTIIRQITLEIIEELKKEPYEAIVFTDLGSGNLSLLETLNKKVFVLDHHLPENSEFNGHHINPLLFDHDEKELSGAGSTYFFCKELNQANQDLAHLAIIGAIGDIQENKGFIGLNKKILDDAENIEIKNGLRMFGSQTRPIHKVLEYSTDPFIPDITGNEFNAISFLKDLQIEPKLRDGSWRKLIDLKKEEMQNLISAIIMKRVNEKNPEDVTGPIYLLKSEDQGSPLRDLKEFSTLLNCCGRLGKPSLGIGTCLGDEKAKQAALELLREYRVEIMHGLNWFYENKSKFVENKKFVIINAEENVKDSIIGTITSIIAKANLFENGKVLISMAHTLDGSTKVSARVSGHNPVVNVKEILSEITSKINCSAGGHRFAAGTLIPQEKEKDFMELLTNENLLNNQT